MFLPSKFLSLLRWQETRVGQSKEGEGIRATKRHGNRVKVKFGGLIYSGQMCYLMNNSYWLGQKVYSGSLCYRKTQTNFLANPIHKPKTTQQVCFKITIDLKRFQQRSHSPNMTKAPGRKNKETHSNKSAQMPCKRKSTLKCAKYYSVSTLLNPPT